MALATASLPDWPPLWPEEVLWQLHFAELQAFVMQHGHGLVVPQAAMQME
jgi:hypothetical protein